VTVVEDLQVLGAATLGESGGHPLPAQLKAAWSGACLAGPAWTADCPDGDNLALHVAVVTAPPGSVLIGRASAQLGNWGEVLATAAQVRGVAGLVLDGGTRDTREQSEMGFAVFSTGIWLAGAQKVGPGTVGAEVQVCGVGVRPGDWVVGDADGVVIIAASELDDVLARGKARAAKEVDLFVALEQGRTTVELLGLDASAVQVLSR
jgi:4-hydroxy-4-methyl-2-oxoglutarate aldolase